MAKSASPVPTLHVTVPTEGREPSPDRRSNTSYEGAGKLGKEFSSPSGLSDLGELGEQEIMLKGREDALERAYREVDVKGEGNIDVEYFYEIAEEVVPKDKVMNLDIFDQDSDKMVNIDEFQEAMMVLLTDFDEEDFAIAVNKIILKARGGRPLSGQAESYAHPVKFTEFIEQRLAPTLRQGMLEMLAAMQEDRLTIMSGELWAEDGYLPKGFKPFNAARWLGEWLRDHNPRRAVLQHQKLVAMRKLGRLEKLKRAFAHIDRDSNGTLTADEIIVLCGRFNRKEDLAAAEKKLREMDENRDGVVDFREYMHFMSEFTANATDDEFDAAIQEILAAFHLSHLSREEKFIRVFEHVDVDGSGELTYDEFKQLGKALNPNADAAQLHSWLSFLDADADGSISLDEFVSAMKRLVEVIEDDDALDDKLAKVFELQLNEMDPAHSIEPYQFQQHVMALPLHDTVPQISPSLITARCEHNGDESVVFVDVREPDEQLVSTIHHSIPLHVVSDPGAPMGYRAEEDDATLLAALSEATDLSTAPFVVCFDSTGMRGAVMAARLQPLLPKEMAGHVFNMCGGILRWYNEGLQVVDEFNEVINAVHPGSAEAERFITRPTAYKLPLSGTGAEDDGAGAGAGAGARLRPTDEIHTVVPDDDAHT